MNVFVQEPLLDWEKLARRVAKEQGGNGMSCVTINSPITNLLCCCREFAMVSEEEA
jgi:hypothetical protein